MGCAGAGPQANRIDEFAAGTAEPARVADEPAIVGHGGFFRGVKDAEKVIRLRERKLGVAECGHGRERGALRERKRANRFVAREKRVEMIEVDGHGLRVSGIIDKREPLNDVALDGVGLVRESEVDDGGGTRGWSRVAPEKIGSMEIVVGPERRECGEERSEFRVKRREKVESLIGTSACGRVRRESGARG